MFESTINKPMTDVLAHEKCEKEIYKLKLCNNCEVLPIFSLNWPSSRFALYKWYKVVEKQPKNVAGGSENQTAANVETTNRQIYSTTGRNVGHIEFQHKAKQSLFKWRYLHVELYFPIRKVKQVCDVHLEGRTKGDLKLCTACKIQEQDGPNSRE